MSDSDDEAAAAAGSESGEDDDAVWDLPEMKGLKGLSESKAKAKGQGKGAEQDWRPQAAARGEKFRERAGEFMLGGEELWDPVEEERAKKRQKREDSKWKQTERLGAGMGSFSVSANVDSAAKAKPQVVNVILHGLVKAPLLNGKMGTMTPGSGNEATGRISVRLKDTGEEKMLKMENVMELHTGKLGRIMGLEGAKELNGQLCEFGSFDLPSDRYNAILEDGKTKRIKPANLEVVRKVNSKRTTIVRKDVDAFDAKQSFRDLFITKELPVPTLLKGSVLAEMSLASCPEDALKKASVSGRDLPAKSRIVAISAPRFASMELPKEAMLVQFRRKLVAVAKAYAGVDTTRDVYFMVPGCVAKAFPCFQDAVTVHYPYYIKICSEMVLLQEPEFFSKAWTRLDVLLATVCNLPVYTYRGDGSAMPVLDTKESAWLLSSKKEKVYPGLPADGQCLPGLQKAAVQSFSKAFFDPKLEAELWVLG